MTTSDRPRRSRTLLIVGAVLVVPVVLVALLPTFIDLGLGKGILTSAIDARVNGTSRIDTVDASWFGPQRLGAVRIADAHGSEVANLDVTLHAALVPVLFGTLDHYRVDLSGALAGELRDDGSTSFAELVAAPAAPAPAPSAAPAAPLAGLPRTEVEIRDLLVNLSFPGDDTVRSLRLDGVAGHARYVPGGAAELLLESTTSARGQAGRVQVRVASTGLFDANGVVRPAGATVDAALTLEQLPVPYDDRVDRVKRLEATARATDLSQHLDLTLNAETAIRGETDPSVLEGTISVASPIADDGRVRIGLDALTGVVSGRGVPSALLQPLLAGSGVVLARDAGPALDLSASFSSGATKDVSLALTAARAVVNVAATVSPDGAINGSRVQASFRVQPALVDALAKTESPAPAAGSGRGAWIEAPVDLSVKGRSFRIPAPGADGRRPLGAFAVDGEVIATTPIRLTSRAVGGGEAITLSDFALDLSTTALRDGLTLKAGSGIDIGRLAMDLTVVNLIGADGAVALAAAIPVGTVSVEGVRGETIAAALTRATSDAAAPSLLVTAVRELLVGPLTARLAASRVDESSPAVAAEVQIEGTRVRGTSRLTLADDALRMERGEMTVDVTPALATAVQGDAPAFTLASAVPVRLTAQGLTVPRTADGFAAPSAPVTARLAFDEAIVGHASLKDGLRLAGLFADVTATLGTTPTYGVKGRTTVHGVASGRVADVAYDLTAQPGAETTPLGGTLTLEPLSVSALETLLGYEAEALTGWLGASGRVVVDIVPAAETRTLRVTSALPNLVGTMTAAVGKDRIDVTGSGLRLKVAQRTAERWINVRRPGETTEAPRIAVGGDVDFTVERADVTIPPALLGEEPFEPAQVAIDLKLIASPLTLRDPTRPSATTVRNLTIEASCDDLSRGLRLVVKGATAEEGATPGSIAIDGTVLGLGADGTLDVASSRITVDATVEGVPTALADALLGQKGLLVLAVGSQMSARLEAREFSSDTGWVGGTLTTTNGRLEGKVFGRDGALHTTSEEPVKAALAITPSFGRYLLRRIHPIFADVRTVEQPVQLVVPNPAVIPIRGGASRLSADLNITVGAVELDSGSTLLGLLQFFDQPGKTVVPGFIEPITARIRDGVVTYDRFAVRLGKHTMLYQGRVDLVAGTVDLRTELPLSALTQKVNELQGFEDKIVVPIVTRGALASPKTELDPKFDLAGAAVEAGFRGSLNKILEDKGIPIGDILGNIFGGKKDKK